MTHLYVSWFRTFWPRQNPLRLSNQNRSVRVSFQLHQNHLLSFALCLSLSHSLFLSPENPKVPRPRIKHSVLLLLSGRVPVRMVQGGGPSSPWIPSAGVQQPAGRMQRGAAGGAGAGLWRSSNRIREVTRGRQQAGQPETFRLESQKNSTCVSKLEPPKTESSKKCCIYKQNFKLSGEKL